MRVWPALQKAAQVEGLPVVVAFRFARTMQRLRTDVAAFETARNAALRPYVDTSGNVTMNDLPPAIGEEIAALVMQRITLVIPASVTLADLERSSNCSMTSEQLEALMTVGMLEDVE